MSLKRHLRILISAEDASISKTIRVAFATTDRKYVNQHFGSAEAFAVYTVTPERAVLVELTQFGELRQDGQEDKLSAKLSLLEGCVAVYCTAIGGSAIRQLLAKGIQPIRVRDGAPIDPLLRELKQVVRQDSSGLLKQAMERQQGTASNRFDAMEAEGWQE
jgi:nitrogen fixation protein NifX